MDDKVSIIVPVYNSEKTLKRCLESLINQSYKNIEILLINDGSQDGSIDICNEYAKKESRIVLISQDNAGVSSARNVGILNSTGKFLSFVDSDDFVANTFIEKLHDSIVKTSSDMAICNFWIENCKRNYLKNSLDFDDNFNITPEKFYENFKRFGGFLWNKMFKKTMINNLMLDTNIHYCEDELFVTEYVEKVKKISYTAIPIYHYCINHDGASSWKSWNTKKITIINAKKRILSILKKYDFNIYKEYYLNYFFIINDIYNRYSNEIISRDYLKKSYKKILVSSDYSIKEKSEAILRFRMFKVYNFIRYLFHFIKG